MQALQKRLRIWAVVIAVLISIPLTLTALGDRIPNNGWHWEFPDCIFAYVVLFGAACTYELISANAKNSAYKIAAGIGVFGALALLWINAAVGIIGNDDGSNLLYMLVPLIGLVGAGSVHAKPKGMSHVLFAMAIMQFLVPMTVYCIWKSGIWLSEVTWEHGSLRIFALNTFFVLLFSASGLLFRKAAMTAPKKL